MAADPSKWIWLRDRTLEQSAKKHSLMTCFYCGKEIPTKEAVVREDLVMCQKCAEDHPSAAKNDNNQIRIRKSLLLAI